MNLLFRGLCRVQIIIGQACNATACGVTVTAIAGLSWALSPRF